MKFERLHISGFGRLLDLEIDFAPGLTVVAGPNEAGKSTIVECLLRLLFGFPETQYHKARKRYEPWQPGLPYGARLRYRLDDGRAFEVKRDFVRPDVPTLIVDADTQRPVVVGNKSTSPGEDALHVSMAVYRSAAVMTAGDDGDAPDDVINAKADRLAKVVGSAGDASAAEAIERLRRAYTEIGMSGPNTPLGKATREAEEADRALQRFHDDYVSFEDSVRRQTELEERVHELTARRSRCAAALAARELRALRARITAAGEAQAQFDAALAQRPAEHAETGAIDHARIDDAIDALRAAEQSAADADARAKARTANREALQREVDAAGAALIDKRANVAKLEETIAGHARAAQGRPPISIETLAALEREADEVDAAESRARTLETAAAIARQRSLPSNVAGWAALAGGAIAAVGALAVHLTVVAVVAVVALAAGIAFTARFWSAMRRREAALARAQRLAEEAARAASDTEAALAAKCRSVGCPNVAAVRAARTGQVDLDRLAAERNAALEAAELLAAQRQALAGRLEDLQALEGERRQTAQAAADQRRLANEMFDSYGVPAGTLEERVAAYRQLRDAGEARARADVAVANARAALDRALGGKTLAELEAEATRCGEEAAHGGDLDEFAAFEPSALEQEYASIDRALREAEAALEGARARVGEFDRMHPVPVAELEERSASSAERRDRLRRMRAAAETAWRTIEEVKDAVHRDFTPVLNEALGRSLHAMTGGRYATAWVDPADFRIRVRVPETDATQDESALSTGTKEQLQFGLRAAIASALGGGAERVPVLYDDALAHADDGRAKAALARAAELGAQGEQIIFFTQRGDVESLAGDIAGVRVVHLPGPGAS